MGKMNNALTTRSTDTIPHFKNVGRVMNTPFLFSEVNSLFSI